MGPQRRAFNTRQKLGTNLTIYLIMVIVLGSSVIYWGFHPSEEIKDGLIGVCVISLLVLFMFYFTFSGLGELMPSVINEARAELKKEQAQLRARVASNEKDGFLPFALYDPKTGEELKNFHEAVQGENARWEVLSLIQYTTYSFGQRETEWLRAWLSSPQNAVKLHKLIAGLPSNHIRDLINAWASQGKNLPPTAPNEPAEATA